MAEQPASGTYQRSGYEEQARFKAWAIPINQLVPALWSQLQQKIDDIPGKAPAGKHMRPQGEILEELVSQVRGLGSRMRDLDPDFADRDLKYPSRMYRDLDPRMIDELMHGTMESRDGDFSLINPPGMILAGRYTACDDTALNSPFGLGQPITNHRDRCENPFIASSGCLT